MKVQLAYHGLLRHVFGPVGQCQDRGQSSLKEDCRGYQSPTGSVSLEEQAFVIDKDVVRADPHDRTVLFKEGVGLGCRQIGGCARESVSVGLPFKQRQLLELQELTVPVEVEHPGEQPEGCSSGKQRAWEAPEWMEEEVVGRK